MPLRILLLCCLFLSSYINAQKTFPQNGVFDEREDHYAFTNATIQVSPEKKIENGILIIKKGKVVAVGQDINIPKDAVTIDLKGKYIYPSFIDLESDYGMPKADAKRRSRSEGPQMLSDKPGAFSWNEALKPEMSADEQFTVDSKKAEELRKAGFGLVLTHQHDGIARGSSCLALLGDEKEHEMILKGKAAAHYSFSKGSSSQDYPSSLMGAIALIRQAYYDAQWYAKNPEDREYNISLEKWNELQKLPQIFEAGSRFNILRADKIAKEFGVNYIFKSGVDSYIRLDAIKATGASLIVPVDFPDAYDVSDPFDADNVELWKMLHWELAPTNPAALAKAGINFAFTTEGLKKTDDFIKNLQKAYQHGLSEVDMLKALTTTPAKLMGIEKTVGSLETGMLANFFISSGPFLSEKASMLQHWIKGKPYHIGNLFAQDIRGSYELTMIDKTFELKISGELDKPEATIIETPNADSTKKPGKLKIAWEDPKISFNFEPVKDTSSDSKDIYRLSGIIRGDKWEGQATDANGKWLTWTAKKIKDDKEKPMKLPDMDSSELGEIIYPFVSFGYKAADAPKQETVLIKEVTVWTNEKAGIIESTNVLIENGKIAKIGKNIKAPEGAREIDGKGKHLTAGIIDEHSHIAIQSGVNEGTQASSAEVRIGDVTNSEDINIYRQLGGGVTMVQSLHGSANPIGGQAQLNKLRWGKLPDEMHYEGAKGFIKFALGENVKQSNWGDNQRIRFPQTRMGVEQVYEDFFTRAKEYGEARAKLGDKVRRDLELDALYEIIKSERFITCHSYIQSEITMLMRVAEKHGFRINTFTHILEGYKVADKMRAHGAGGSSFSDWWAYKYEVLDAIPYNAKILDAMEVVTAINSDDAEMGRRLNQEAAKGVKYGNMNEEDALKMVTLNPAKLLRCDDRVGSIKVGKDADVVLWTDHPLSVYAKAEKTFVDGICYFDLEKDKQMREALLAERSRLIQKMLNAKSGGAKTQPARRKRQHHYHCADMHLNELDGNNFDNGY